MSKHTPGPWRRGTGSDANRVFDSQGRIVAERTGYADGHLIAAAPDLLAALHNLADTSRAYLAHMDAEDITALEIARIAIAKAEG